MVDSEALDKRLTATIEEFLDAAASAARSMKTPAADEQRAASRPPEAAGGRSREEVAAETYKDLRGYLADELTVVSKLSGEEGIEESEREREIAKGALAMLRKPELQRVARLLSLSKTGTKDELLDRLVATVGPDPEAVASLIARAERRPSEGRRHASRLFVFEALPDAPALANQLAPFQTRYVRTDRARWFVLDSVETDGSGVSAKGKLRTYEIEVQSGRVEAHPKNFSAEMRVEDGEPVLRTYARYEAESVAAVEALGLFIGELPVAPFLSAKQSWEAVGFDPQTTWLLDLLLGLLDEPRMTLEEVTSVSFEKPRAGTDAMSPDLPYVGSARLRGQHVLDSQVACRHLTSGERVAAVTALMRFERADDKSVVSLPVRFAVTRSHVAVMTGFGLAGVEASRTLHRHLEDHVVGEIVEPARGGRVATIIDSIKERAVATDPPTTANLFARISRGPVKIESVREEEPER